jgi:hypothetical protein
MPTRENFSEQTLTASAEAALEELGGTEHRAALVEAWVKAGNAAAVQEVAEHGTGQPRKAARRGLNVLKSRGVPIPARRKTARSSASPAPTEATMVPPDGSGTIVFVFSRANATGGCSACFVYVLDNRGVERVERVESTPSKIKAALARTYQGIGARPVSVPLGWARQRVQEARQRHRDAKIPEPLGFDSSKDLLEPLPMSPPEHPFDSEGFEFADDDAREMAKNSGALHHLWEFASWLPSPAAISELLRDLGARLAELTDADSEPENDVATELLQQAMLDATDRYFTEDRRQELVLRMKDMALSILAHRGEREALEVAATLQVIGACGLITNPPNEVPFLRAFFEKAIALASMQQGGKLQIPIPGGSRAAPPAG